MVLAAGCVHGPDLRWDLKKARRAAAENDDSVARADIDDVEAGRRRGEANFWSKITLMCVEHSARLHGDGERLGSGRLEQVRRGSIDTEYLRYWSRDKKGCRKHCGRLLEAPKDRTGAGPLPRDLAIARRHLDRCEAEVVTFNRILQGGSLKFAITAVRRTADRGDWLGFARALRRVEKRVEAVQASDPDDPHVKEGRGLADAARAEHAEPLRRVRAYHGDPRLARLERRIAELDDIMRPLYDVRAPQARSRARQRLRRLGAERDDLVVQRQALRHEHGVIPLPKP